MAKTDWTMNDTVMPKDMNDIGQEINEALSNAQDALDAANGKLPYAKITSGTFDFNATHDGARVYELKNNSSITILNGPDGNTGGTLYQGEGSHGRWMQQLYLCQNGNVYWRASGDQNNVKTWYPWAKVWTSRNDSEIRSRFDVLDSDPANPPIGYAWIVRA